MNLWIMLRLIIMGFILWIISVNDYRHYKINHRNCIMIGCIGIVDCVIMKRPWIDAIYGMISVTMLLMLIYIITKGNGIGGGDIKLMAMSGIILGWKKNILAFFTACIGVAFFYPVRKKIFPQRNKLAFGPYLSAGIMISLLWGEYLINAYLLWPGFI